MCIKKHGKGLHGYEPSLPNLLQASWTTTSYKLVNGTKEPRRYTYRIKTKVGKAIDMYEAIEFDAAKPVEQEKVCSTDDSIH